MIIFYILLLLLIIIAMYAEYLDRQKIPDILECKHITDYCNAYGEKNNIKYVAKEPINNKESVDLLLNRVENDVTSTGGLVYWRISLIVAVGVCLLFWGFNALSGINLPTSSYFMLLILTWFLNYWMRNFLDYHYYDHMHVRVKNTIQQIKDKLSQKAAVK